MREANLLGLDPVATDADQRAHLDQVVRGWAARHDVALTVNPFGTAAAAPTAPPRSTAATIPNG